MEALRRRWSRLAWTGTDEVRGRPLPSGGQFGQGHRNLDPDIFDGADRMHPWIRLTLIDLLEASWHRRFPDWRDWARIYLAGSLASYWWGTMDFDVLVGVHTDRLFKAHPEVLNATANAEEEEVSQMLTKDFYTGLDVEVANFIFPPAPNLRHIAERYGTGCRDAYDACPADLTPLGPLEMTFYCNAYSWDIRRIKPYAAYDVTNDHWAVHPIAADNRYGPKTFSNAFWSRMADSADRIQDALTDVDPTRAAAEYDRIHSERNQAFSASGGGQWDPRAWQWTVMSRWGLLGALEKKLHPDRMVAHPPPDRP